MHSEVAELLGLELAGRQRLARVEAERRAAEGTGAAAIARLEEQLAQLEKRIDSLKLGLYFPPIKGYTYETRPPHPTSDFLHFLWVRYRTVARSKEQLAQLEKRIEAVKLRLYSSRIKGSRNDPPSPPPRPPRTHLFMVCSIRGATTTDTHLSLGWTHVICVTVVITVIRQFPGTQPPAGTARITGERLPEVGAVPFSQPKVTCTTPGHCKSWVPPPPLFLLPPAHAAPGCGYNACARHSSFLLFICGWVRRFQGAGPSCHNSSPK
jgi:hypothetical protein